MPDLNTPYLERSPGDLITAEDWNDMQRRVRHDIGETTQKAVEQITRVQAADDADKLAGKSVNDLTDEIVRRAVQQIRAESGYRQLFKVLRVGEDNVVKHDLHLFPLVDVYQLDYFQVVACEDKDTFPTWATFYLHHESEDRVRFATSSGQKGSLPIQPDRGPKFQLKFSEMLSRYGVKYDQESSLGDVETDFWHAFNSDPNDRFSDDQCFHSPWWAKCCREEKTVGDAIHNGDWDDLYLEMRPRKTINYPAAALRLQTTGTTGTAGTTGSTGAAGTVFTTELQAINLREIGPQSLPDFVQPAPTQVQVTQYDFDTLGLTLLAHPVYPNEVAADNQPAGKLVDQIPNFGTELKVMVLLKV